VFVFYNNNDVKIIFEDLNDVTKSKNLMKRQIGNELTRMVKKRYNQLVAFPNFYSALNSHIGKMERLAGDFELCYSMHINANYRLIVKPITDDYSTDKLIKCEKIYIEGVVDYHGSKIKWIIP